MYTNMKESGASEENGNYALDLAGNRILPSLLKYNFFVN